MKKGTLTRIFLNKVTCLLISAGLICQPFVITVPAFAKTADSTQTGRMAEMRMAEMAEGEILVKFMRGYPQQPKGRSMLPME